MTDELLEEQAMFERFRDYYANSADPALRELERRVLGVDYGGNSATDAGQAGRLAELLGLQSGHLLLDIGSGAGWPGMFLARESGCRVIFTDKPLAGLWQAATRAAEESIRAASVAASGTHLPFRAAAFDAVTHSDVLC